MWPDLYSKSNSWDNTGEDYVTVEFHETQNYLHRVGKQ